MSMINNLFSSFDPSTYSIKFRWLILLAPIILTKTIFKSKHSLIKTRAINNLEKEINNILQRIKTKERTKIAVSIFLIISIINAWALIPSSFRPTAQIIVNLPLALTLWIATIIFSAIKKTNNLLTHLVPNGTPTLLMPLIVLIELTRNIIRPLTLSIRLTANIVAGHILISLAEEFICSRASPIIISISSISILTILESAVAIIQAYIFSILITLYISENH